ELLDAVGAQAFTAEIDREARDMARAAHRIPARAVAKRHERERIELRHLDVDVQTVPILERPHDVRGAARRSFDPAQVASVAAAPQEAEIRRLRSVPRPVNTA